MNPFGESPPVATEAEFFNAARHTVFLLVEGASDVRLWETHVDRSRCQVRGMQGRDSVVCHLEQMRGEGKSGFVAVLDADFDRVEGTLPQDRDVVFTDLHDIECTLVASPALDKVLTNCASREKLEAFQKERGHSVRDELLLRAVMIGRLRWLSRRNDLKFAFRKDERGTGTFRTIDHAKFCDDRTWQIDPKKLVQHVINFNSRHELNAEELLAQLSLLPDADAWQVSVGHDLVALLVVGLRRKLGSRTIAIETMQDYLTLAFERDHLVVTKMYHQLRAWERQHPRFHIFKSNT